MSSESDEEDLEGLSSSEESEAVTEAFEGISRNFELSTLCKILNGFYFFLLDYCDPDNETSICQGLTFEALFPDGTYGMTFDGRYKFILDFEFLSNQF